MYVSLTFKKIAEQRQEHTQMEQLQHKKKWLLLLVEKLNGGLLVKTQ